MGKELQRLSQGHLARAAAWLKPQPVRVCVSPGVGLAAGPNRTLLPGLFRCLKAGMHDGSQRQGPRAIFVSCVVSVTAQREKLRQICARVRPLYPGPGAVVTLGASLVSPSGAESRGHSSLE